MRLNVAFCWIIADLAILPFASLLASHPPFNITPHCPHPMQKIPRIERHFCSHLSFVKKGPNPWKTTGMETLQEQLLCMFWAMGRAHGLLRATPSCCNDRVQPIACHQINFMPEKTEAFRRRFVSPETWSALRMEKLKRFIIPQNLEFQASP